MKAADKKFHFIEFDFADYQIRTFNVNISTSIGNNGTPLNNQITIYNFPTYH